MFSTDATLYVLHCHTRVNFQAAYALIILYLILPGPDQPTAKVRQGGKAVLRHTDIHMWGIGLDDPDDGMMEMLVFERWRLKRLDK